METDPNWRELIDSSFGDGPGHRPMGDRLAAGRRALRLRRVATGVATAVVAAVIGGAAWATVPSESRSEAPISGDSDGCESPSEDAPASAGDLVTWTGCDWRVAPGWTVVDRVDNPVGYEPPERSVGLELRKQSRHVFALATDDGDGGSGVTHMPVPTGTTLQEWLPAQVDNARELEGKPVPRPVEFGDGETLVPADGVTIIDQLPHPDLPANFATTRDRTAAAWIEVNGNERFVLVRDNGGQADIIPFTAKFANLQAFLRYAQKQYEGEGGLR